MDALTLLLPLAALFVVVALTVAGVLGATGEGLVRILSRHLGHATALRAVLVLAPPVAGLAACLAILVPGWAAACHCTSHGSHHPHLCLVHPVLALPLVLPALALLIVWGAASWPRWTGFLREVRRTWRWRQSVAALPRVRIAGVPVRLGHCGSLGAVTVGYGAPEIVLDARLATRLTTDELTAVVLHEQGHRCRRDPLTLLVLRLWSALCPLRSVDAAVARWRQAAELACDGHAAALMGSGAPLARALVHVEQWRHRGAPAINAMAAAPGADLELRVRALVDAERPPTTAATRDLTAALGLLLVAVMVAIGVPGDGLHHAAETAGGWLLGR